MRDFASQWLVTEARSGPFLCGVVVGEGGEGLLRLPGELGVGHTETRDGGRLIEIV